MSHKKPASDQCTTKNTRCIPKEEIEAISKEIARSVVSALDKFAIGDDGGSRYDCSGSDHFTCGTLYDCASTFFATPDCPSDQFDCQGHFSCSGTFQG